MTLTEFLLARIAEDEAVARDAGERRGLPYESPLYVVDDNYRHDQVGIYPERVLAECEAKRAIANFADYWRGDANDYGQADQALRIVSAVYADHPDYRQEWKP